MNEQSFPDRIAQESYRQGEAELETTQSAETVLRKAKELGEKDARAEIMQSAWYYLAAANFLEHHDLAQAAQAYHQAGYQLHRLNQFTQAGHAYSNAGRVSERAAQAAASQATRQELQHLAVRSYSRANHCFAEMGELEWSETEYLNERNARVIWTKMQGKRPWAQLAWKATSNYGTSFARWGAWVVGTISTFGLSYELFFRLNWLAPLDTASPVSWTPLWSGIYYSVNITSALGLVDYQPAHFISQAVVIINVLVGYILLGIGIGIIGQMIKIR